MTTKKTTSKPSSEGNAKRVTLVNTRRSNGAIGAEANVLEADQELWIAKGWKLKDQAVSQDG